MLQNPEGDPTGTNFDQQHENLEKKNEIEKIIQGAEFRSHRTQFSLQFSYMRQHHRGREVYRAFECLAFPFLKEKCLVDLGCGVGDYAEGPVPMVRIASDAKVKKYIGVDRFGGVKPEFIPTSREEYGIDIELVMGEEGDMLRFLFNQQSNSTNIVINGIDEQVIPSNPGNRKYLEALAEEIKRVIGPNHIVFGIGSQPVFKLLELIGMKKMDLPVSPYPLEVFHDEQQEEDKNDNIENKENM